jgi:hypothetical protein
LYIHIRLNINLDLKRLYFCIFILNMLFYSAYKILSIFDLISFIIKFFIEKTKLHIIFVVDYQNGQLNKNLCNTNIYKKNWTVKMAILLCCPGMRNPKCKRKVLLQIYFHPDG